jgi:UDP-sugar transporter A1/2/3
MKTTSAAANKPSPWSRPTSHPHPRLFMARGGTNTLTSSQWKTHVRKIATPVSILGGTAVLYGHVLQTTELSSLSLFYMVLLAIQYAIQPRLSKKYIKASSTSVALAEEVVKTSLAAALYCSQRRSSQTGQHNWSLSSSLTVAAVPAVLYAAQGVLQYQSQRHLDAVTFNGLSQTKTLSAAFWCWLLLGKPQSPLQSVSLLVLLGSALLFQKDQRNSTNNIKQRRQQLSVTNTNATTTSNARFFRGVVPCVLATLLSGLAGALSQKGLQTVGRDAYFYAMEVSFYSAITLVVAQRRQFTMHKNWREGWTWNTMLPVVCKAAGGVLTVLVHKHTGTVSKGFALMFGLVLAGMLDSYESVMPIHQVVGTLLVILSGWLHFTQ